MSKKALVILAPGAEEMEAVIAIDILRRASVEVTVASLESDDHVACSRNVVIKADTTLANASTGTYDVVVLPGGFGGSKAMCASQQLGTILRDQENSGKMIAAICAAPLALKAHSVCLGKYLTSYPALAEQMSEGGLYSYKTSNVVVDGNLITSRGPGTSFEFALTIVDKLQGTEKGKEIEKGMLLGKH